MKRFLLPLLLAFAPTMFGSLLFEVPQQGHLTVDLNANRVVSETFDVVDKTGSWVGGDLEGTGFSYSASWDQDPFISWTYTTNKTGHHVVKFDIPIFSDTYALIFQSAGYTLTTKKGTSASKNSASIKNTTANAYVPWPDVKGNIVPEGYVSVADSLIPNGGTLTKGNDNTNSGGIGPFVKFGPRNVASMGLVLEFDFASSTAGASDVSFNGTLTILPVPEPATFTLIGIALVGLGALYRRRQA